ncbi:MAG: radical SAM protein [Fimbriimonadales bacterium]
MRAVTIYATSHCNLRCKHCAVGLDQYHPRPQLETGQLSQVVRNLAKSGTRYVTILGGEATAYVPGLVQILDVAEEAHIQIAINTNLLIWKFISPLLCKPALNTLIISLDGATADTHDQMRGQGTFKKTLANIDRLNGHPRVASGEISTEISYVMSRLNIHEAAEMVSLAASLGARRLNVKPVKMIGRASRYERDLHLDSKQLLDAYCETVLAWLMCDKIQLDLHLTPVFARYINERFDLNMPADPHPACGGPEEFGYVDLRGNLLPCPAMAYEENLSTGHTAAVPEINLLAASASEVTGSQLFTQFEHQRKERASRTKMWPCRVCSFSQMCAPCTADIVKGDPGSEVEICAAVYEHSDEYLPGFSARYFSNANIPSGPTRRPNLRQLPMVNR